MARVANKLSAKKVESLKEIGKHSDGNGLYLRVAEDGKRWIFLGTLNGKRMELGLGGLADVSLAAARDRAAEFRALIAAGKDPRVERAKAAAELAAAAPKKTFGDVADDYIARMKGGWKNDKHREQWYFTLSLRRDDKGERLQDGYCLDLRNVPIDEVDTEHVVSTLTPIWEEKPETARRLRGRIEAVIDAAKSLGLRTGENPAVWRGHLKNLMAKNKKLSRGHHAAMGFEEVPAYLAKLHANPTQSNLALSFTILTAGRSGEILGAEWTEIDEDARLWRVPGERMKAGKEHVVPLSDGAMAVLTKAKELAGKGKRFVFPGQRDQLSVMALTMAMRRTDAGAFTPHGFRSAFRDWAGDRTHFARDDIELCLAHTIKDVTERAYRRGNALEKRRQIMDAWWRFLCGQSNVVPIREQEVA